MRKRGGANEMVVHRNQKIKNWASKIQKFLKKHKLVSRAANYAHSNGVPYANHVGKVASTFGYGKGSGTRTAGRRRGYGTRVSGRGTRR